MSPAILTSLDQSGLQEFPKPSIEILWNVHYIFSVGIFAAFRV